MVPLSFLLLVFLQVEILIQSSSNQLVFVPFSSQLLSLSSFLPSFAQPALALRFWF
jgi:hypothetical protein